MTLGRGYCYNLEAWRKSPAKVEPDLQERAGQLQVASLREVRLGVGRLRTGDTFCSWDQPPLPGWRVTVEVLLVKQGPGPHPTSSLQVSLWRPLMSVLNRKQLQNGNGVCRVPAPELQNRVRKGGFKTERPLGWGDSVGWASSHGSRDCWFDSQSGHILCFGLHPPRDI